MSLSNYRLKVQQGNTIYTCDLYTTPEEARSVAFADHPRVCVNIGGTTYYCGTAGDASSDIAREQAPIAVFYDATVPRLYRIAQKSFFSIGITASANQTITVTASNKPLGESGTGSYSFTSGTKYFPYGTTWTASVSGSTGWNAGTLTPASSGTLTNENVTVTASAATHKTYKITLTQKSNETVTIHYKNHDGTSLASSWSTSTSTVTLGHGSQYYLTIAAANANWTAGTITNAGTSSSPNTLTAAVTVSFTAATHVTYKITLTQKSNETVTIHYKNHDGSSLASSWSTSTSTVTLGRSSQYYCTIAGSTYYTAGTVTNAGSSSSPNTLTAAVTISFGAATHITYKITLTQKSNETVTIHYKNHNGSALASSWSTTTSTITLGKGSKYYSTIAASTGYTAGTITSAGTSSSPNTLSAAVTISFTAATAITPKISFTYSGTSTGIKVKYTNTSGSVVTASVPSSVTIKYNTSIFISHNTNDLEVTVYQGSQNKGVVYQGGSGWTSSNITSNTTYTLKGEIVDNSGG